MKNLLIAAIALAIASSAAAQWHNYQQSDDFEGTSSRVASVRGEITRSDRGAGRNPTMYFFKDHDSFQLHLRNGAYYICDDVTIAVLVDGKRSEKHMRAIQVWESNEIIQIANPSYWYAVFKSANTLRIRTDDGCDATIEMRFDVSGAPDVGIN